MACRPSYGLSWPRPPGSPTCTERGCEVFYYLRRASAVRWLMSIRRRSLEGGNFFNGGEGRGEEEGGWRDRGGLRGLQPGQGWSRSSKLTRWARQGSTALRGAEPRSVGLVPPLSDVMQLLDVLALFSPGNRDNVC